MNKLTKLTAWVIAIAGLALQQLSFYLTRGDANPANPARLLTIVGMILLIIACAAMAERKGYSRNYGLLGILSWAGLILVTFLPNKNRAG